MQANKNIVYKTYCFEHKGNIMFFYYNSNHPIMMKNLKFQLGRVKIYTNNKLYTCQITSTPHLIVFGELNEQYFTKLFHGLSLFELEQNKEDEYDDTLSLVARDHFQEDQIYLLRAKLTQEIGYDLTNDLWNTFSKFNTEKTKSIQSTFQENIELRKKADFELSQLIQLQQRKEQQKRKLKGQLSALLHEKQAKLSQYNDFFEYFNFGKQSQPSLDLTEQKLSMSIAGSLFQQSQQFAYYP